MCQDRGSHLVGQPEAGQVKLGPEEIRPFHQFLPSRLASLASTTIAAASSAEVAIRARARFVDVDGSTIEFNSIELLNRPHPCIMVHLNKGEAARATRIPIGYYGSRSHFSDLRKQIGKLIFCRAVRQVSNEYSHVSPRNSVKRNSFDYPGGSQAA
jgi:hypothetical protein